MDLANDAPAKGVHRE